VFGGGGLKQDDVALGVSWCLLEWQARPMCDASVFTKSDIAVSHPRRDSNLLIRRKSRHLVAGEKIPDYGGRASVVTQNQAAGPALANVVCRNPRDVFPMPLEAAFYCEGVVVKTQDYILLCVEQEGGGCGAWLEGEFIVVWS
jgi:hypothetical protein